MIVDRRRVIAAAGAIGLAAGLGAAPRAHERRVFVGSYSFGPGEAKTGNFGPDSVYSEGIYSFGFDPKSGRAGAVTLAARTANPSNLIVHPGRRFLYAGSSRQPIVDGQHRITSFAIEGGSLREIGHAACGGGIPTQGVVDRSGRNLLITNFESDNIVCLRLGRDGEAGAISSFDGKAPGVMPANASQPIVKGGIAGGARQPGIDRMRPHMVLLSPDERFAIAAQMGQDACAVYRFDASRGLLMPHGAAHNAEGSGPRHIAFGRDGRFLYSADEESSTITVWYWDAEQGTLAPIQQISTRPAGYTGISIPAHVAVHPSGNAVYVNNRGVGTLAGFAIDRTTGRVTPIGQTPLGATVAWHFAFDPDGRWLLVANQSDSSTRIFAVNASSGALTPTGQVVPTPLPTSLQII